MAVHFASAIVRFRDAADGIRGAGCIAEGFDV
jgi:hypothetical protein